MRRRADDWINATHILKAAGFDKPARTRILEREVQKELHEKIQGGYGKYQGQCKCNSKTSVLTSPQEPGSLLSPVRLWRNGTVYTISSEPFLSSSQET